MKKVLSILLIVFLLTTMRNFVTATNTPEQYIWNAGVEGGIFDVANVVNVLDFGAKGDGVTDDYQAFNAAISAVTDGGGVFVPKRGNT